MGDEKMATVDFAVVGAAVSAGKPLIVDARTEDEFAAGRIPGAINIPLSEVEFAFSMPEEKFMKSFGISKPGLADLFITSCKVGGRAAKMRDKLIQMVILESRLMEEVSLNGREWEALWRSSATDICMNGRLCST